MPLAQTPPARSVRRRDGAGSTLDAVKTNAMNFYNDLNTQLTAKGMTAFPLVRVRMIYFKKSLKFKISQIA